MYEKTMHVCMSFWNSVHSCSRIWNSLTSNLLGKPRIHCEIACLRLFNVFVEAISGKFAKLWLHQEIQHTPSPIHCSHSCRLPASHCWIVCSILVKGVCFWMELTQNCKSEPGGWFRAYRVFSGMFSKMFPVFSGLFHYLVLLEKT